MTRHHETTGFDQEQCTTVSIQLAEYCAGELDPVEVDLVDEHLRRCPLCRAELDRERCLRATLAALPLVSCPDRVTEAILAEVDGKPAPRTQVRLSRRWTTYVGLAAAAAAAVMLLVQPLGNGKQNRPAPVNNPAVAENPYSPAEVQAARQDLKRGLLLTARIINQTERSTVKEVFGRALPESVNRSLKTIIPTSEGGQG